MTNQELIEIIKAHVKESDFLPFSLAQAIIAKYPQILAEKVCDCTRDDFHIGIANNLFHRTHDGKQYELYLREVR